MNPFTSFLINPLNMTNCNFHKLRALIINLDLPVTSWGGSFYVRFEREADRVAFEQLLSEALGV